MHMVIMFGQTISKNIELDELEFFITDIIYVFRIKLVVYFGLFNDLFSYQPVNYEKS